MLYAIIGHDVKDSLALRRQARPAHLGRLRELQSQGRLIIAGPLPAVDAPAATEAGFTGSLIVAEFESLQNARDWAHGDPYMTAGVYASVDVRPFMLTLPE